MMLAQLGAGSNSDNIKTNRPIDITIIPKYFTALASTKAPERMPTNSWSSLPVALKKVNAPQPIMNKPNNNPLLFITVSQCLE
jgi:hypothetical protein